MIVEQARHKGADDKVMRLKGLVYGRRLVDPSCDRLEVLDVEDPWVQISIPAHNVEGMVIQDLLCQPVAYFDPYFEFASLGVGLEFFRQPYIALGIRRVFKHLSEFISIAFGRLDLGGVFNGKEARFAVIQVYLPGGTKGDHNVITFAELQVAELRLQCSAAFMD